MAKQYASQTAAADAKTAAEVTGANVADVIDKIPEGTSASVTDGSPVQGEINVSEDYKSEFMMPYTNKSGEVLGEILVKRL
ncbi:hypothetical protein EVC11_049 [Rhizobium phage RHph_I20]|uniref:Uncharacterized protein n=1 Tax=Rhizobium phage RHph_I20 TaxID=2509730 RepID=A0A7S5UZM9_9CAUD|nr:hypothetical protein EVC11_049 [Rhizobium phage RHph_I20]